MLLDELQKCIEEMDEVRTLEQASKDLQKQEKADQGGSPCEKEQGRRQQPLRFLFHADAPSAVSAVRPGGPRLG